MIKSVYTKRTFLETMSLLYAAYLTINIKHGGCLEGRRKKKEGRRKKDEGWATEVT
jgi:hypothetical protein